MTAADIETQVSPILMVDDHELDLRLASICHQRSGISHPFVTFQNAAGVLDHLDRIERGDEPMPHMILVDVQMPGMNGFALVKAIRARPAFVDRPAVAFLTTSEFADDRDHAQRLACDYHVKPFELEKYIALFQGWAS